LVALCRGRRNQFENTLLLLSTVLISITGLASLRRLERPRPIRRAVDGIELVVMAAIALAAIHVGHLDRAWRGVYIATMVLAVYLNVFVAIVPAFQKIGFLPRSRRQQLPFPIARTVPLAFFLLLGVTAFRRYRGQSTHGMA
jgi:hypothetical protein